MSRYDGLIIPRSYSEYINKTDAATLSQALQLPSVMDSTPTENSNRPVKSGGIYTALAGKQPTLTFDTIPTEGSNNPVESGGIYTALAGKQPTLTFDTIPTEGSENPVTSDAVYVALKNYQKRITCNITSSNNFEISIENDYSSWIIGGLAQGQGAFSEFLNLSREDINKTYGYVKLEYSASEKKITLSSTSNYDSSITLLYLNGV